MKRGKGYFSISAVAKMFSVHQQTIRLYEKEGLISPKRSEGNTRLFSEEDINRLEEIIHLTHKMGVNLAGVEIVLRLQKKINKLQEEMNKLFVQTQGQLFEEGNLYKKNINEQLSNLREIKEKNAINTVSLKEKKSSKSASANPASGKHPKKKPTENSSEEPDEWSIDYDE